MVVMRGPFAVAVVAQLWVRARRGGRKWARAAQPRLQTTAPCWAGLGWLGWWGCGVTIRAAHSIQPAAAAPPYTLWIHAGALQLGMWDYWVLGPTTHQLLVQWYSLYTCYVTCICWVDYKHNIIASKQWRSRSKERHKASVLPWLYPLHARLPSANCQPRTSRFQVPGVGQWPGWGEILATAALQHCRPGPGHRVV